MYLFCATRLKLPVAAKTSAHAGLSSLTVLHALQYDRMLASLACMRGRGCAPGRVERVCALIANVALIANIEYIFEI